MQEDYLESFADTSVGCVREHNEDAMLAMKRQRIFVVADGMGGGSAGEVASSMVVNAIQESVEQTAQSPAELESAVIHSLHFVNRQIVNYASEHGYENMGTTVACLMFNPWHPSQAVVMHAGDSRVYRFRRKGFLQRLGNKNLELLTSDHSLKNKTNVITNGVGFGQTFYIDSTYIDIEPDDLFIVCSDGLSHMVPDREIAHLCMSVMQSNSSMESLCANLIKAALEKGGKDNVTIITIRVGELPSDYTPSEEEAEKECEARLKNIHILERQSQLL